MKILQVIDELSDKNISLVRIAQIISDYKFLNKKSEIVTANNKKNLNNIKVYNNKVKNFLFFSSIFKFLINRNFDIIHIHGLWRPIHILFILHARLLNIPIIIQPHGMLLLQALKSKSIISYILKLITLRFYKLLLPEKTSFIAVTEEEKNSIKKHFFDAIIFIIPNPVLSSKTQVNKIKRFFVYFGRYNSHKNLKELINAYIQANLGKNWNLFIYGIDDDDDYKNEAINLVKKKNYEEYIKFLPPVFNIEKKNKILSQAWCNILISKSEVLSLSVLEALSVGTKSLVNSQIYFPIWIKINSFVSSIEHFSLTKKIKSITSQTINEKKKEKNKLKKIFKKNYILKNLTQDYQASLKKTIDYNSKKKFNVMLFFLVNFFNLILVPYFLILNVIFSYNSFAAEIGLVPGIILLLNQVFSANSRSLLLYGKKLNFFHEILYFRIIFGLLILFFILIASNILDFVSNYYILFISICVYLSWIIEIILALYEKNKSFFLLKFFLFINFIFYCLIFLNFLKTPYLDLNIIFFIYILLQILFIGLHCEKKIFRINKIYANLSNLLNHPLPLFSSFSSIIAVIIWRFSLLLLIGKEMAGIFFASFAIASFPGTVFNNIIAQIIILNNRLQQFVKDKIKLFFVIYYLIIFVVYFFLKNISDIQIFIFLKYTWISLIGTPIMLIALYHRHKSLSESKIIQNNIFLLDIYYAIILAPIILVTYYFGGISNVAYAYVLSAITALIVYFLIPKMIK